MKRKKILKSTILFYRKNKQIYWTGCNDFTKYKNVTLKEAEYIKYHTFVFFTALFLAIKKPKLRNK